MISYGKNVYDSKEIKAVNQVLKNSTQMGQQVTIFEKKISKLFGKKHTVMVNSGSSALELAFSSLNYSKGSNFITPILTFGTTISSMLRYGYIPNFVDINLNTLCINESLIEKSINKKTVGICVPNLIGNLPDWTIIKKIAKKYNLIVIEDSADTLGYKFKNSNTSKLSDITITSFYGSHIVSCAGNGGSISVNSKKIYEKILLLRSWGRSSSLYKENSEKIENRFNIKLDGIDYDKKFVFSDLGYNFEPSEIGASFGNVQLSKLNNNIKIRQRNFMLHLKFFSNYKDLFYLPSTYDFVNTAWLAYPIIIKSSNINRKKLMIFLEKNKIQTRVVFTGNILRQPGFKKIKCIGRNRNFLNSDFIMKNSILIGLHHGLKKSDIAIIHKKIKLFLNNL